MGIESTGRWRFLRGAYVDGQLVVGSIALNGADLAATLANLSARIAYLEARIPPYVNRRNGHDDGRPNPMLSIKKGRGLGGRRKWRELRRRAGGNGAACC